MLHSDLTPNRWHQLSLSTQMAHIGSEVVRAINWHQKGQADYAHQANTRALELFDLTIGGSKAPALKEICRARELWLDYFLGNNQYRQTAANWQSYFLAFNFAARSSSPNS